MRERVHVCVFAFFTWVVMCVHAKSKLLMQKYVPIQLK